MLLVTDGEMACVWVLVMWVMGVAVGVVGGCGKYAENRLGIIGFLIVGCKKGSVHYCVCLVFVKIKR